MNSSAISQFDLAGDIAASRYLRICRTTFVKLRKEGRLPFYKVGGRYMYISFELKESFYQSITKS